MKYKTIEPAFSKKIWFVLKEKSRELCLDTWLELRELVSHAIEELDSEVY